MEVIGRDAELALVVERLRNRRLVTLVGLGGIGKTTLAREAAARCAPDYDEGSRFVDLTRVDNADAVRESLAAQLGYASFRALLDAPGDHSVLVVVDNCEHVVDAVADAVGQLLDACQMPTVLATSRSSLELPGEVVVPVGPLELPAAGTTDAPSIDLFVERARDAGTDLEANDVVAELCRRLNGVPLAIELAAARTRSMTPAEILSRISSDLDVLDRPRWRGARRHQSLRAAVKWSYDLLDPEDKQAFDALGVFTGPFTADLAEAVAGISQSALDRLVNASMVAADRSRSVTWYRQLDTLRAFAREHLDARGVRREIEARLADLIVQRVTALVTGAAANWSVSEFSELVGLYENIAACVRWSVQHDERPDRAFLLTAALWGVVHQSHTEEIGSLAEQTLGRWPSTHHPLRADVVATAATCWYMLGHHERAVAAVEEVLPSAGRTLAGVTLRRALGQSRRATGDAAGAMRWFSEAGELASGLRLTALAAEADAARAQILADLGEVEEGLTLVRHASAQADAGGAVVAAAWARVVEGSILLRVDPRSATELLTSSLAACRELGYTAGSEACLRCLVLADLLRDDVTGAARRVLELLDALLGRGSTTELRLVFDVASVVLARAGRSSVARDLSATALGLPVVSITASVGHELFPPDSAGGRPLSVRDAILATRAGLGALVGAEVARRAPADDRVGVFRRAGDYWEVGFAGELTTLRGSKGMDDLAMLLRTPGREVHCRDLVGTTLVEGGTGPTIDAAARRAYEQRVRDLQAELEEAEANYDGGRAERARVELDAVVDELTAALGLAGRDRQASDATERARQAVTQRIRATLRRIEGAHGPIGRHLNASVRTGTFCCYSPEEPVRWQL